MQLGMIGLGRIGASMAQCLLKADHACVVHDTRPGAVAALCAQVAVGASSLAKLNAKLNRPRTVCLMVPAGSVDPAIEKLAPHLDSGDMVVDNGIGASIAANKVAGVRAGLIHDVFSARQGVEDDDMNVFCLGGKVIGSALALELIRTFLAAHFSNAPRHQRRLTKVQALETNKTGPLSVPIQHPLGNALWRRPNYSHPHTATPRNQEETKP